MTCHGTRSRRHGRRVSDDHSAVRLKQFHLVARLPGVERAPNCAVARLETQRAETRRRIPIRPTRKKKKKNFQLRSSKKSIANCLHGKSILALRNLEVSYEISPNSTVHLRIFHLPRFAVFSASQRVNGRRLRRRSGYNTMTPRENEQ